MTRARRLALGLTLTLLMATSLSWWLARTWLVEPAQEGLETTRVETVLLAAQRMREGVPMEQVEAELGVDLRMEGGDEQGPPRSPGALEGPGPPPGQDRPDPPPEWLRQH